MSEHTLKDQIRNYVQTTDYVSFAELSHRFPGFAGGEMSVCQGEHLVLWSGMTEEAATAVGDLLTRARDLCPSSEPARLLD